MATFDPLAALALPEDALVDKRVPKSLLIDNGAPTSADRRRIREGIEELRWVAALKPTTIGVAEFRDGTREYLEIAVLNLILRSGAHAARLAELVHRAVPYPVLLVATNGDTPEISLAHKRWSQAETGKTVIDGEIIASGDLDGGSDESTTAFRSSLALDRQRRTTLHDLYQGWIDTVEALNAARVTGEFTIPHFERRRNGSVGCVAGLLATRNQNRRTARCSQKGKPNRTEGRDQPGTRAPSGGPRLDT